MCSYATRLMRVVLKPGVIYFVWSMYAAVCTACVILITLISKPSLIGLYEDSTQSVWIESLHETCNNDRKCS